ncbi:MAG: hypothetical protein PQJ46_03475 [Spirochaetales bacterium]|nr:hypothetical protein [Spirochaetales bacterium]
MSFSPFEEVAKSSVTSTVTQFAANQNINWGLVSAYGGLSLGSSILAAFGFNFSGNYVAPVVGSITLEAEAGK